MIKYIGSKRLLLPHILAAFEGQDEGARVLDLFSGTSRVGHALKARGLRVSANDHNAYAHVLARCYIGADATRWTAEATTLLAELQRSPSEPDWFTDTYSAQSRFFHPINAGRIEGIRNAIAALDFPPPLEAIALVSLMEAADRVDSTTGLQMAYLKSWAARANNPLQLRLPKILPGEGHATCLDAASAAKAFTGDAAYLDPPYNQHNYRGNYHIWETLVRWDKPEIYGKACKRTDVREAKSPFNSKKQIAAALRDVVQGLDVGLLVLSFNNEGYLPREDLEAILSTRKHVRVIGIDHKRYVGAQIGIFNPSGEKVGEVSHMRNTEYLFLAADDAATVDHGYQRVLRLVPKAA